MSDDSEFTLYHNAGAPMRLCPDHVFCRSGRVFCETPFVTNTRTERYAIIDAAAILRTRNASPIYLCVEIDRAV